MYQKNHKLLNEVKHYKVCATPRKSILCHIKSGPKYHNKTKCDVIQKLLCNNKQIHRKFFKSQQDIPFADLNKSWLWLKKLYLRFKIESLICAAQE